MKAKIENEVLSKLVMKYGTPIAKYYIGSDRLTTPDGTGTKEDIKNIQNVDFTKVGYYFIIDEMEPYDVLAISSIGDQTTKLGFNDRISRIRRGATKVNRSIINNHDYITIVFVPAKNIKHILKPASKWANKITKMKKTERNTILENMRFIKSRYHLFYQ